MLLSVLCEKLVRRLAEQQVVPGLFLTETAPDLDLLQKPVQSRSPFFLSLILSCLASVPGEGAEFIRAQLQTLLWKEVHVQGSFNYWLRDSEQTKTHPCPDDLDTTSCVYASFLKTCPEKVDGARLAEIVLLLTLVEEAEGGPYRTWIVKPEAEAVWKDVDLIVNANIAHMLRLCDVRLEGLDAYGVEKIFASLYDSVYYPLRSSVLYFLSRAQFPGTNQVLEEEIWKCIGSQSEPLPLLDQALLLSALLSVEAAWERVEPLMQDFLTRLEREEAFPARALYVEAIHAEVPFFAGSSALTVAMCLEVVARYSQIKAAKEKHVPEREEAEKLFLLEIQTRFDQRFASEAMRPELRERFVLLSKRILGDWRGQEIPLLPYRFHQMLGERAGAIDRECLVQLGMANVYGWMAYTVYDDILDDEGKPAFLSIANLCLREMTQIFTRFLPEHGLFQQLFVEILDGIDGANTWEVVHCRLIKGEQGYAWPPTVPPYGERDLLAQRSLGHGLGPLALLFAVGFERNAPEMQGLLQFFRHYLIARQLDDDAHDWDTDLLRGQVNCVASSLMYLAQERGMRVPWIHAESMAGLQELFWQEEIVKAAESMLQHVEMAEQFLQVIPLQHTDYFQKMLEPIRVSAERALAEHQKTRTFLEAYQA